MTERGNRPTKLPWPPLLYIAAIALGVVLGYVVPLPWFGSPLVDILLALGLIGVLVFVLVTAAAIRALRRAGTTVMPTRPASVLVTTGPFSFTRNPIYLANTVLVVGIGLATGNLWLLLLAFVADFLTTKLAIEPEERHLGVAFGKRYRDYAKRVRRWI
jgi:protein-S-isoprenylcysteine O-methyltransferase Ste14